MAYDTAHSRIVLFGGCADLACAQVLNDTWTWDGANWNQQNPPASPPARNQGAMTFDPVLGRILMFGGRTNGEATAGSVGDMWAWDGQTWTQLHPQAMPAARYGTGMAYSRVDSGLLLAGGIGKNGYLTDTWIWNGIAWTEVNTTTAPSFTSNIAGLVYDAAMNAVVLSAGGEVWTWGGQ
jgi:hypothetical protein